MRRHLPLFLLFAVLAPLHADYLPRKMYSYDGPLTDVPIKLVIHGENSMDGLLGKSKDVGFDPFLYYWGDFLANPVGGQSQAASWMQLLVFGGEIDLQKTIGGPSGGSIFVSAVDAAGSNLSLKIGNLFTVSQAYVMNTFSLYALYYKQELFDGKLDIRVGRLAAGQYFASLPAMGLVVSGAVNGNPTSLFVNSPFHSTASASWAAYAKYQPSTQFYLDSGIFQASPRTGNPAYHGADFSIRSDDGILLMSETGWTPTFGATPEVKGDGKKALANPGLPGIYTLGGYYSHYTFDKFAGGIESDAFGFYGIAEQMVWRDPRNENQNLTFWGGLTYSPQPQFALMPLMGMGGGVWQGCIPKRDSDRALFSVYSGNFSSDYSNNQVENGQGPATVETVLELSYIIQLTKNVQVQPDVQYVIQPNGQSNIPNALVIGFQVSALF